jgi:cytochrome c oxidase subunit 3
VPPARIAVWLVVSTVTLLFAAFTSSYLVRRTGPDWQTLQMPVILWFNTVVLALSSLSLEWSRREGLRQQLTRLRTGITMTTALGVVFLVGQIVAWRHLAATGIFLASNPHSSFFYLLTGAHGLHIVGGLGALFYAVGKTRTAGSVTAVLEPVNTFWHFLGVLWIYLLVLLFWI